MNDKVIFLERENRRLVEAAAFAATVTVLGL